MKILILPFALLFIWGILNYDWQKTKIETIVNVGGSRVGILQSTKSVALRIPVQTPSDKIGKVRINRIYQLESSGGKNDSCRKSGKYNGFGFGQSAFTWNCFNSYEEVASKVEQWFDQQLKDKTVAQALCYYNLGKVQDDCTYYRNYLALKI